MAKPAKAIAPAIQKITLGALRQNSARINRMSGPPTAPIQASVRSGSPSIIGPGSGGTNSSAGSSSASSEKPRWSSLNRSAKERSELVPARQELAARGSTSAVESSVSGEASVEFDSAGGTVKGPSPSMMACQAASSVSSSSGEEPVMLNTLDCPPGLRVSTRWRWQVVLLVDEERRRGPLDKTGVPALGARFRKRAHRGARDHGKYPPVVLRLGVFATGAGPQDRVFGQVGLLHG